jgi:predicted  nucleic acid-binding Zn-ribbon protein
LSERENAIADKEASLAAWEERVQAQAERMDRERTGHSRASQEAFTLMAELERREEALSLREQDISSRGSALHEAEGMKLVGREQMLARAEAHLASLREQLDRREEKAAKAEADYAERLSQVEATEDSLRKREARLGAELELRADKLETLAEEITERERRMSEREQDLAAYVGELQQQIA